MLEDGLAYLAVLHTHGHFGQLCTVASSSVLLQRGMKVNDANCISTTCAQHLHDMH